jgi:hypothetical protein
MSLRQRWLAFIIGAMTFVAIDARAQTRTAPAPPRRDAPPPSASTAWTGVLRGQVVDAATGRGIPRAAVELRGGEPRGDAGETTDEDGMFAFRALPPGRFSLEVTKTGYNNGRLPEGRLGRRIEFLELRPGETRDKIIFRLVRASAITGRVVDQFDEPAPNTRVWLRYFPGAREQSSVGVSMTTSAMTNDIGEFRIAPVRPGSYLLVAVSGGDSDAFRPRQRTETGGFVAWPAGQSLDEAQPLIVEVGQTVSNVELRLFPLKPVRVSGVVLLPDGKPADGAMLTVGQMLPSDRGSNGGTGAAVRDGAFSLTLMPGTYEFRARSREGDPVTSAYGQQIRPRASAVTRVTVADTPLEDITIQLAPPRRISGRLVFEAGLKPPPPVKTARLSVAYVQSRCEFSGSTINDDATFSLDASGDRCFLGAGADGWQVRSITHGGRDVLFEGLSLTDPQPLDDLVVTFTDRLPKLAATVSNPKGLPASEFVVVAFPADKARRPTSQTGIPGLMHRLYRATGPLPSGNTTLDGLFAGDYLIVALDPDQVGELPQPGPEWFERLEPIAQRITITDGDIRTINLKIAELPADPSLR